jgi:tRNA G10  N-methylase Trm11
MQRFKSIYLTPGVARSEGRRYLTLAFGPEDQDLFEAVKHLSSQDVRSILGHASARDLEAAADAESRSVNAYCLSRLRLSQPAAYAPKASQYQLPLAGDLGAIPEIATYKAGSGEPTHEWYPYLEGFSPAFVHELLSRVGNEAGSVIDPFAGTGTTPIACASSGFRAFYCELNPLLQFLVSVKAFSIAISQDQRISYARDLERLRTSIASGIEKTEPNGDLVRSYKSAFGGSEFFSQKTFDLVLRSRSHLDHLYTELPHIAPYAELALLASLVPASKLIRRGDLRFKTSSESRRSRTNFFDELDLRLSNIARDLPLLKSVDHEPVLLCEDARTLERLPRHDLGAVITSPPYLNGTNYFRNTKLELWFLRCLANSRDLQEYRRKAVTSGINDVTVRKRYVPSEPAIKKVLARLESDAYDRRIPTMVGAYFGDIARVFEGLSSHLRRGAPVLIDIGDSCYGNIHVPTNQLLRDVLERRGYQLSAQHVLRRRSSRSGRELSQSLLAFRFEGVARPASPRQLREPAFWTARWTDFRSNLPHARGEFAKRNWGHPLHSLCSYQGKMKPSLAHFLVKTFAPYAGRVLDPFAGVGTIPFEAALQGVKTFSFDLSPAAIAIARGKLGRANPEKCLSVIDSLASHIREASVDQRDRTSANRIRFNGTLSEYFAKRTFEEVLKARRYFLIHPPETTDEALVFSSLLHVLHGNRPYALSRRSHPITPFAPTGDYEYRSLIEKLRDKVARSMSSSVGSDLVEGSVYQTDATAWWPSEVDQLDAIITSPPFFDSTRFYLANWMRLWFCGWELEDFKLKPKQFVDERQKKGLGIYESLFRQARERLKPGGVFVLHLGKSRKCDMGESLAKLAAHWFSVADLFVESVQHCESHGISDKGTVTDHQYLILN